MTRMNSDSRGSAWGMAAVPPYMPLRVRLWRLVFQFPFVERIVRRRARELIRTTGIRKHLKTGGRYLDIGTGAGHIVEQLVRKDEGRSIRYLAIDPVWKPLPRVLRSARQKVPGRLLFARGDGTRLPVRDGGVDGVSMFFVLHHIPYPLQDGVVEEISRVLREDGVFFLLEDTPENEAEWERTVRRDRRLNFESAEEGHYYRSGSQWREYLAGRGFTPVDEVYFEERSRASGGEATRHRGLILRKRDAYKKPRDGDHPSA